MVEGGPDLLDEDSKALAVGPRVFFYHGIRLALPPHESSQPACAAIVLETALDPRYCRFKKILATRRSKLGVGQR